MEKTSSSLPPIILLQFLHMAFPQFAEKGDQGQYLQQDANECWLQMMRVLQQKLEPLEPETSMEVESGSGAAPSSTKKNLIDQMKCTEAEDEEPIKGKESQLQLSCFINQEVKYLATGLRLSKLSRLPAYLTVQMVRFFYKEKESVNAKVLKDVKFPLMLDVYELCTAEVQEKMLPIRSKFKEIEDMTLEQQQKKLLKKTDPSKVKYEPFSFPDDLGSNNSGFYDLQAVLTHQGRSSSSGHYVGWVKRKEDEWVKFDDDKVSVVSPDDILRLSGGGDWHIAEKPSVTTYATYKNVKFPNVFGMKKSGRHASLRLSAISGKPAAPSAATRVSTVACEPSRSCQATSSSLACMSRSSLSVSISRSSAAFISR
ncbi:Ubiquitin carboxyl-terminal hydrolase 14 [Liparis tanakae]|uniref:ubiquitinyl hydrolase 1 n=1 Tax=Liparis tanakae TaxID=230148 RepID=A0A4Z2HPR5_9TELE|nr:Ubiquitin carboxyl-terminal hydrolase 14 [Liparis tanakae]